MLWLDASAHILYRSENQGKQWEKVNDIGPDEANYLYEHPFDSDKVRKGGLVTKMLGIKKLTAKCRLIFWVKAKDIGKRLIRENHGRNFLHP